MTRLRWLIVLAAVIGLVAPATAASAGARHGPAPEPTAHAAPRADGTFFNPIGDVEDPTIVTDGGYYYLIGTNNTRTPNKLTVRKSATLAGLRTAVPVTVWQGPPTGLGSSRIWSPVLEKVRGTWYVYLSVTDDADPTEHAALYALQGNATDPLGPYTLKNKVKTWDKATSDGKPWENGIVGPSVTELDGKLYLSTTTFGFYMQRMADPWSLEPGSTMATIDDGKPTLPWEGGTGEISRPIVHKSGAKTVVSMPYTSENHVQQRTNGGPCWSFCIGMFVNTDGELDNPSSWHKKPEPAFAGGPDTGLYRLLAVGTFTSPDGGQDWMVYNGNDTAGTTFSQRYTFAQRFTWNADGTPDFGRPVPIGTAQRAPSGEKGSPPPQTPGSVPVDSDFGAGSAGWTPLTGTWSDCDGHYCATGGGDNLTRASNTADADYTVQATVTPDNAPNGSGVDVIGRLRGAAAFYEFELLKDSAGNRKWVIGQNRPEGYRILASGPYDWTAGTTYTMRFDLNSANLTALISTDGSRFTQLGAVRLSDLAGEPSFPDYGYGAAALRTWGGLTAKYARATVTRDRPSMGYYAGTGWPGLTIDAGSSSEENKNFCVQKFNEYCVGGRRLATKSAIDTSGVRDPLPAAAYRTERWNDAAPATRTDDGSFHYVAPSLTPGRDYRVRLHFAEIHYTEPGRRAFDVEINGKRVLTDFDKVAAAGGPDKAVVREFTATANANGDIDLRFAPGTSGGVADHNPTVSGIQVLP